MQQQLPTKKCLNLEAARNLLQCVKEKAQSRNLSVVIAIVDDGGHLICLDRMDGVQIASVRIAEDKAAAALRFKRPTKAMEEMIVQGRVAILNLRGNVPVEGGLPIVVAGEIIGAIGVSGASSREDGELAEVAVAAATSLS